MNTMRSQVVIRIAGGCTFLAVCVVLLAAAATPHAPQSPPPATSGQIVFSVDPAPSRIHWVLDTTLHTVHGTFSVKRGELRYDPATSKASGEIVVDATSGASGNDSRDKKMHKEILESPRYTEIIFRPDRIDGKLPSQGAANLQIHGMFSLHGSDHEMILPVVAELSGTQWKGTGKFSIPYIQWGLKNPSNFLLKVKPDVEIELELNGVVRDNSNK
jgi:polyisoprenoid-binding protein YceI